MARGKWGENLAATWYLRNGWRVIGRNVRNGHGEIDIIATKDNVVAVVEVKARRSAAFGSPAEALTRDKQRAVRSTAFRWAAEHGVPVRLLRFDLVCITGVALDVMFDAF